MDKELILRLAQKTHLTDPDLDPWMTDYGYSEAPICKFAQLIAAECANITPNEFNVTADQMPHVVWQTFRNAILAKFAD